MLFAEKLAKSEKHCVAAIIGAVGRKKCVGARSSPSSVVWKSNYRDNMHFAHCPRDAAAFGVKNWSSNCCLVE